VCIWPGRPALVARFESRRSRSAAESHGALQGRRAHLLWTGLTRYTSWKPHRACGFDATLAHAGLYPQSGPEAEELLADDPTPRRPSRPTGLRLVDGLDAVVADVAVDRLLHAACGGFARHGKRRNSSASAWVPDSP
jgi:hypothetical protein